MSEEAEVTIRLDSRPAQSELKSLNKEADATAKKVSGGLNKRIGAGIGGMAAGVGLGAMMPGAIMGQAKGAVSGGLGDILGENLGPFWELLKKGTFGDAHLKAAANSQAMKQIPPGVLERVGEGSLSPRGMQDLLQMKNFHRDLIFRRLKGAESLRTDSDFMIEGLGKEGMKMIESLKRFLSR